MNEHNYSTPVKKLTPGQSVKLLQNSCIVGVGKIVGGNILHNHTIPDSFIKISITQIKDNITPLFKTTFDQPYLSVGEFTAWPTNQCVVF